MPTNHYFNLGTGVGSRSEQNLLQMLTTESIQIGGADFVYLPRTIVNLDELFKEDYISKFEKTYTIEMYIENYDDFLGQGEMIGKFGFQLEEQLRLFVSRERFMQVVGTQFPTEGDLLYFPVSKHLFEIKFVDDKKPLFPLGSRSFFVLVCDTFKYSHETFSTGTAADDLFTKFGDVGATTPYVDPFAKNKEISEIAEDIVNWDESNPFGKLG
jgi:hypothetical protein